MATQAHSVRDNRLVVLLSGEEKAYLSRRAKAARMSLSEFVRTAAEHYAPPAVSDEMLTELVAQVDEARTRMQSALDRLDAYRAERREIDENAIRARVRTEMESRKDIDWSQVAAALGLTA